MDSVFDRGYLYPNEEKIMKFLEELYKIPFSNSQSWEDEIFSFFKDNPFVIYLIERSLTREEPLLEVSKEIMQGNCHGVKFLDTNTVFKELCGIRDSIKINKELINKYVEYFLSLSIMIRKMSCKVIDEKDTNFHQFSSKVFPTNYECKMDDGTLFYENIYFLCADGKIEYDFKSDIEIIRKRFANRLKQKLAESKPIAKRKRTPIESRLRHECFKRDGYKCVECGATKEEKMLHCDHIIPVSQGGTDELCNLQTLCDNCNLAKSDKCFKGGIVKDGEQQNKG